MYKTIYMHVCRIPIVFELFTRFDSQSCNKQYSMFFLNNFIHCHHLCDISLILPCQILPSDHQNP